MAVEEFPENYDKNPLTCIHNSYTVSGTRDGNEVDELIVKHFLNTLAEVSLSIVSRLGVEQ
jgi:hypothetical protein